MASVYCRILTLFATTLSILKFYLTKKISLKFLIIHAFMLTFFVLIFLEFSFWQSQPVCSIVWNCKKIVYNVVSQILTLKRKIQISGCLSHQDTLILLFMEKFSTTEMNQVNKGGHAQAELRHRLYKSSHLFRPN